MSDDNAEKAKEQAGQAASQAKAATKSGGRALRETAEEVTEGVGDHVRDVAENAEIHIHNTVESAKRVDVGVLSHISSDLGVGFLALSFSIWSGAVAVAKFRAAAAGRSQIIG